jgi:hypothetical protein
VSGKKAKGKRKKAKLSETGPFSFFLLPFSFQPRYPGKAQQVDEWVGVVHAYPLSCPHSRIEIQQAGPIGFTLDEALPHKQEVIILLPGAGREEQRFAVAVHR